MNEVHGVFSGNMGPLSSAICFAVEGLERLRRRSRLLVWPTGAPMRLAIFWRVGDEAILRGALDAIATFHPGSNVRILVAGEKSAVDALNAARLSNDFPELSIAEIEPASEGRRVDRIDTAMLIHPWPWATPRALAEMRPLRKAFADCPAARKWILFRNLELWDGSLRSRIARRLIDLPLRPSRRLADRMADRALECRVLPRLPAALAWTGDAPCRHDSAESVFTMPRTVAFCPACGMGITPPARAPRADAVAQTYGPGYARGYLYVGRREWAKHAEECAARMINVLRRMGFPLNEAGPGARRILDYGCGNGRYARLWRRNAWNYAGIDPSPANIDFARSQHEWEFGADAAMQFHCGDLGRPGALPDTPVDLIFFSHVIEHVPGPVAMLAALRERAAAGGWLFVETPDAARYAWSAAKRGFANIEHLQDFTPNMLAATARAAGWSAIQVRVDVENERFPFICLLARNGSVV